MRGERTWFGAVCSLCLSTGLGLAACSEDGALPPMAARDVNLPPGQNVPPAAAGGAAGALAPGVPQPPAAMPGMPVPSIGAQMPIAKPYEGLPVGPDAPPFPGGTGIVKQTPTDTRGITTVIKVPPISGGTLAVTPDDRYAVASDPDRDRISVVDLGAQRLVATIPLNAGDEPGRVAIDAAGRAHVALRRGGAVVSIDIALGKLLERRAVCAAPRGIEYGSTNQRLFVACQNGDLVSLPLTGTDSITRQSIGSDLRDVFPRADGVFVSRFKSAELLSVDLNGAVQSTAQPAVIRQFFPENDGSQSIDALDPLGARRVRFQSDGTAVMLHQTAREGEITLDPAEDANGLNSKGVPGGGSAYGGAGACTGVSGTAVTMFDSGGRVIRTMMLSMGTLPVDIAWSPKSHEMAIATAGALDPFQPTVSFSPSGDATLPIAVPAGGGVASPVVPPALDAANSVMAVVRFNPEAMVNTFPEQTPQNSPTGVPPCVGPTSIVGGPGPATAVAYLTDERLIVQTREPATILIAQPVATDTGALPVRIELGGPTMLDTGHEIFHRDAGAGVACATCHLEGDEDGHTWVFAGQGPRRTQALSVGLEGTAPFHWVGDMTDLGKLMENVFVGRMGGVHQAPERLNALARWMFSIQAPLPLRAASDPAVARGHELFVGAAECSKCHEGTKLTNNQTVDVGTGLALQVPSLVGVGLRAPWLHTGCAKTLQQRFDPSCGGTTHGKTAQLTTVQVDDLVAYLESL
jgi:hypothetical protein